MHRGEIFTQALLMLLKSTGILGVHQEPITLWARNVSLEQIERERIA